MCPREPNVTPNGPRRSAAFGIAKLLPLCLAANVLLPQTSAQCAEPGKLRAWLDKLNVSGSFDYETYQYPKTGLFPGQKEQNQAIRFQFRMENSLGGNWRTGFAPFVRYDFIDNRQSTIRLDEGWVEYAKEKWDVRIGNQIFSWGQMESVNLIDGLNPRDYRDDIVEPAKIGIPAVRFRWKFEESDLSFYALPYYKPSMFPERYNFYSISGGQPIDNAPDKFEAQGAVRYFHAGDGYDFALSYTNMMEHTPLYDFNASGVLFATPFRAQRFGIEATKVLDSLLLKGQGFYRIPQTDLLKSVFFYTLGAEYTFPSVIGLSDLTLFAEYFGTIGSGGQVRFQALENSLFTGIRWTANDQSRQEFEAGVINNFNNLGTYLMRISYRRNLTDSIQVNVAYTDSFGFFVFPNLDEDGDGAFRARLRYSF